MMNKKDQSNFSYNKVNLISLSSVLIPGFGQFLQKKYWRGLTICISFIILAFLIAWSLGNYEIAEFVIGGFKTSWLYFLLISFWIWNVVDSISLLNSKSKSLLTGVFSAIIILFVIAWNVTEVRPNRLVERFNDAKIVTTRIVNPDFFSVNVNGNTEICSWDCLWANLKNWLSGQPTQNILLSNNLGDIFGRIRTTSSLGDPIPPKFETGKLVETIAIGLMATLFSTIMAIPISFLGAKNIMDRVSGGNIIYYVMRTIFNIVRAVDTVVWGIFIVVWVGLGSFAGVIALTIHSTAALAKLFSEEIEHIDPGPMEAITATGGNILQVIRYAVIPQIIPPFLGYTLLRWDINMRSATVVGFVAGGGIGYFVLETIQMGAYQQYAAALWAVAVVIIIVDTISSRLRENIILDKPRFPSKSGLIGKFRTIIYFLLGFAVFIYCWNITEINLYSMIQPGPTFLQILKDFISINLSPEILNLVTKQIIITILQAMLATFLGAILAAPVSFLAAKNLTGKSKVLAWLYYLTRSIFNFLRSIEALLYAAIFVFWVGIGPFAGMLALAVTTFALIGKLFSEAIENIESGPIEAVNATGANRLQMIFYAIIPQIVPSFVSYLVYQWDINIRMATIIGFAGGGGIGLTLSTFFGSLQYHKAGTVVLFIVVVVALMDFASAKIRESLV
jgi:phosphonate ABC transporter permease subunit PhnE